MMGFFIDFPIQFISALNSVLHRRDICSIDRGRDQKPVKFLSYLGSAGFLGTSCALEIVIVVRQGLKDEKFFHNNSLVSLKL